MRYSTALVNRPGLILFGVLFFTLYCLVVVTFHVKSLDFKDPSEGIVSRKTEISKKWHAYNLLNGSESILSPIPYLPQRMSLIQKQAKTTHSVQQEIECSPRSWQKFFKVIIGTTDADSTLLDVQHIKSLCEFSNKMLDHPLINKSCGMISLLDNIRDLTGANCDNITQDDITSLQFVISTCAPYYVAGMLNSKGCNSPNCVTVPKLCYQIYHLFYYFTDDSFYENDSKALKRTLLMFALTDEKETTAAEFYIDIFAVNPYKSDGVTKVVAIDKIAQDLALDFQLLFDMLYMGLAFLFMGIVMTLYLRSVIMTIIAAADIGMSLILAFFIYTDIFQIKFFPFLNLIGGLILIALVADDVFLFMDSLETMKRRYPKEDLEYHMRLAFNHAGMSIFVTSFTTSASFFANMVSDITAAKCFGIYAGLCIACNLILMLTFIPSCMVLIEKRKLKRKTITKGKKSCCKIDLLYKKMAFFSNYIFNDAIPKIINKLYPLFIIILSAVGVASSICVFYKPQFSPPTDAAYQAFVGSHPINIYWKEIEKYRFYQLELQKVLMPVIFVWGVIPADTGSVYKRNDNGDLFLDERFNLTNYENQVWLSNICETLKLNYTASNNHVCSLTEYLANVGNCNISGDPCCCNKKSPTCFTACFPHFMARLYSTLSKEQVIGTPYFDEHNQVKALVMRLISDFAFTYDHDAVKQFNNYLNLQLDFVRQTAPQTLLHVYVTSLLSFFDTQAAFLDGAFYSAGISLAVCFFCVLITTRNIVITIYSLLNIALATLDMYAIMILMKWKLNIMESLILSLALGLTIDFVIHFSVAYLFSREKTRETKVRDVLGLVGSPAAMAALTTFVTGVAVLPATAYCYFQMGVFLMLIMVISIVYSIFFFLSLCRLMGPLENCGQIPCPCKCEQDLDDSDQTAISPQKHSGHDALEHHNSCSRSRKQSKNSNLPGVVPKAKNHDKSGRNSTKVSKNNNFDSMPIYQVSRGSMYDSVENFLGFRQTHHQNPGRSLNGNFSSGHANTS